MGSLQPICVRGARMQGTASRKHHAAQAPLTNDVKHDRLVTAEDYHRGFLLREPKSYMTMSDDDGEGASIATAVRQRKESLRKAAMAKIRSKSSTSHHEHTSSLPQSNTTTFLFPSTPNLDHITSSFRAPRSPYISTTEEEEAMSFQRPAKSRSSSSFDTRGQAFATSSLLRRSHPSSSHDLPQDSPTAEDLDYEDEWDYSDTEFWGWVILIATWIVFVVVMGSCFGIWSWAWDVGETPYAPPDLEDDDTLPITGYYPALMVCTAVMSWVWVVVAWVGMKYFRHAKVVADDG